MSWAGMLSREPGDEHISVPNIEKHCEWKQPHNVAYRARHSGSFGVVEKVVKAGTRPNDPSKEVAARKFIKDPFQQIEKTEDGPNYIRREVEILRAASALHLPHLPVYLGVKQAPLSQHNETHDHLFIYMKPWCDFSLLAWCQDPYKVISEHHSAHPIDMTQQWMICLSSTFYHLTVNGIRHRDIKPDNILITDDFRIVIVNFGVSKQLKSRASTMQSIGGTERYMAPEMVQHREYSRRADVFSLGGVFAEMLSLMCGVLAAPFRETVRNQPYHRCISKVIENLEKLCKRKNPRLQPYVPLIARMLAENPHDRPELHEVYDEVKRLYTKPLTCCADPLPFEDDLWATSSDSSEGNCRFIDLGDLQFKKFAFKEHGAPNTATQTS